MAARRKAILFGFLVWLAAFAAAFLIYPIRESSRPLFESIMPVVVAMATAACAVLYFRGVSRSYGREGLVLGCLWLAMNWLIDMPLMLAGGPMQMTVGQYVADIGLTYLVIPAITVGIGLSCQQVAARDTSAVGRE
jgi:hypothetical protein